MSDNVSKMDVAQLAAVISHEIKNPLAGVSAMLEVIGMRLPEGSGEASIVAKARLRLFELDDTLEDLMILARPQPLIEGETSVLELLRGALETQPEDQQTRLAVDESTPVPLTGDVFLLRRMMLRIVQVAFSSGSGPIALSQNTDDGLSLTLPVPLPQDAEKLKAYFDPVLALKIRGIGIRLAAARAIAERHGGQLTLTIEGELVLLNLMLPAARLSASQ